MKLAANVLAFKLPNSWVARKKSCATDCLRILYPQVGMQEGDSLKGILLDSVSWRVDPINDLTLYK